MSRSVANSCTNQGTNNYQGDEMEDEELMQRLLRNSDPLVQAAVSKIHALAEANAQLRKSQMLMIIGASDVLSHIPDRAGYLSATQLYKLQNSAQLLKDAK